MAAPRPPEKPNTTLMLTSPGSTLAAMVEVVAADEALVTRLVDDDVPGAPDGSVAEVGTGEPKRWPS